MALRIEHLAAAAAAAGFTPDGNSQATDALFRLFERTRKSAEVKALVSREQQGWWCEGGQLMAEFSLSPA